MTRSRLVWCLAALLGGCALVDPPAPSAFAPAAAVTGSPEIAAYEARFAALLAGFDAHRLRDLAGVPHAAPAPEWLVPVIGPVDARAAALDDPLIAPVPGLVPGEYEWPGRWRTAVTALVLTDGPAVRGVPFRLPDQNELERIVSFRSIAATDARITATCDGAVQLVRPDSGGPRPASVPFAFTVPAGQRDETRLSLPPQTASCHLEIAYPGQAARSLDLVGESAADPAIAALDRRFDICEQPAPDRMDALERAFFAERWLSQTCVMDAGAPVLLDASRDGYNAKIEALTGMRLSDADFDAGNPYLPLDFSHAPRLDMIWMSYLDLKADFSGALIEQAVRWHAERGTLVRILVSEVLELPQDLAMWERLAAEFPNVQFQLFSLEPPRHASPREYLDVLHRVNHVKLFVTLARDPARSRAILGGRNIHDGFLFDHSLDLSAWPELQQYGVPGELSLRYFSTYHDFEIEITQPQAIMALAAHLATLWHRDEETTVMRPFSVGTSGPGSRTMALTGARHFISVPEIDHHALDDYWVGLLDAARESITLVTPYLNPTPAIEAALNRALARGVEVTIVARVALYGDLGGRLMTEMNALFVERYADRLALYEYDQPDVVLHSKLLLVDGRLGVVSSVNLNRRSFLHDTENGMAILDPGFTRRLQAVVDGYIAQSYRLRPDSFSVRPWVRRLFAHDWVRDLF
ncbi:MAG: phosphatidylserine/phosphatidylglycerophosphate/cardiolipin synthase family protein [Rubellimicrobium sp.]|nr:phosphatidylserine/phosphatidylglycerophosphate/cardiolipin synthase family protein [Rubellimicrobium sp.]